MQSLQVTAHQMIPDKKYNLLPLIADEPKAPVMATTATSMTPAMFDDDDDQKDLPRKFAYKEGHFIPGQTYEGKGMKKLNEEDENAKSVILR